MERCAVLALLSQFLERQNKKQSSLPLMWNVHLGDHSEKAGLCTMSRGNVRNSYALEALAHCKLSGLTAEVVLKAKACRIASRWSSLGQSGLSRFSESGMFYGLLFIYFQVIPWHRWVSMLGFLLLVLMSLWFSCGPTFRSSRNADENHSTAAWVFLLC